MAAEGMKNDTSTSDAPAAASTQRISARYRIPADWLDRLLAVQCSVRANTPLDQSLTQILACARELLEDVGIGVCIPGAAPQTPAPLPGKTTPSPPLVAEASPLLPPAILGRSLEENRLVLRLAPPCSMPPFDADPARLFPAFGWEHVVPIPDDSGATLHIATDDYGRMTEGTPTSLLLDRLVLMIMACLENHRAVERHLNELEAQVIQSEKLASLGQIAAGIVHELNNPLTTIVAYSDFLRKKLERRSGDAADLERLARINEAADRILRFSRDLTTYSRPASEIPAPVAIHDILERALVFCEHELDTTGTMVERNFGDVRPVRGVSGQLTQVFVNLFINAAHAMRGEGGMLTIATSMLHDSVEVVISDEGHGIEEEHRARIFEPFFTTKTDGSGTGLGLSIVRSIVHNHGGRIRVDPKTPRGTVFHLELPTAAVPPSDP